MTTTTTWQPDTTEKSRLNFSQGYDSWIKHYSDSSRGLVDIPVIVFNRANNWYYSVNPDCTEVCNFRKTNFCTGAMTLEEAQAFVENLQETGELLDG
jgi:hypothetical protein